MRFILGLVLGFILGFVFCFYSCVPVLQPLVVPDWLEKIPRVQEKEIESVFKPIKEELEAKESIVIYTAPWCVPCQQLHTSLKDYKKHPIVWVDTDVNPHPGIDLIPTVVYKGRRLVGVCTLQQFEQFIENK